MFRWVFSGCFRGISRVFRGYFKGIARVFLEGFKCILVVLQGSFRMFFVKTGLLMSTEVISVTHANSIEK